MRSYVARRMKRAFVGIGRGREPAVLEAGEDEAIDVVGRPAGPSPQAAGGSTSGRNDHHSRALFQSMR